MAIMNTQLNTWLMLDHAKKHFGEVEIVTQLSPTSTHRYTYSDMVERCFKLMNAIEKMGLEPGSRIATMAWNGYYHLECYFAIPSLKYVLHTLNSRLSPADLVFIINDANDEVIFAAPDLLPLLEAIQDEIPTVRSFVVLCDKLPETTLRGAISYEELIAGEEATHSVLDIPEDTPSSLCYTSGTTGRPKGALYTHRSTYLHALGVALPSGMGISPSDAVLPIVPMFHANAWGCVHASVIVGAKIVFAATPLDPASLVDFLTEEEVTLAAGVPTVWIQLAEELTRRKAKLPMLREIVSGGSQPPRPLIERYREEFSIPITQAWGMTETSPLASMARPKHSLKGLGSEERLNRIETMAGLPVPGISVSIRDANGDEAPWDSKTMGQLYVKGAWVIDSYLSGRSPESFTPDGWFATGDVAIGTPDGYFSIADRTKDMIKSGGEWISSVEMEGAIMGMPNVLEACVIAIPDPKWQERPLAAVVPREGATITLEDVHSHLTKAGFAKWQLPDRLEIIDMVPRTSVGKFDKKVLRSKFGD